MIVNDNSVGRKPLGSDFVRTYLPESLELTLNAKWQDYGRWVVGGLYVRHHTEKQRAKDDFRPTSSAVLKQVLPERNYKDIVHGLLVGDVIEQDTAYEYRAGVRSKAYRLTERYRNDKFRSAFLTHHELVRKVRKVRERAEDAIKAPVHRHLRDNVRRLTLTDDYPKVSLALARIADKDFLFEVCRQGRVHTPLTNLDRNLRRFVRYDGRPLWAVDISNSQPLLMALTLGAGGTLASPEFQAYSDWLTADYPASLPPSAGFCPPSPYVSTYGTSSSDDLTVFRDRCLAGAFFEHLMQQVLDLDPRDWSRDWTRQDVKDEFWAVGFGHPKDAIKREVGLAFAKSYPATWQAVKEFYYAHEHGELPRRMQTVESYLCIWRACNRILSESPDAPLLTVHDCLVTDEQHIRAFEAILKAEYRGVFGFEPKMTTKPF